MATSEDEISKQHRAALDLIATMPNTIAESLGEIHLTHKTRPLSEIDDDSVRSAIPCVSTRGMVDVSVLKRLVFEGHNGKPPSVPSLWDDEVAKEFNVQITRPSHDKWGIRKVVLIFCDDFLKTVYELPWWHDEGSLMGPGDEDKKKNASLPPPISFKQALRPILDALDLPDGSRVVRMLLASMPPGVTIPTHHDTGEWVNKTHRVHVPVITDPSKVLFR